MKPDDDPAIMEGFFDNVEATPEGYLKRMSDWGKEMEDKGIFKCRWCIMENKIQLLGSADFSSERIRYPIGTVAGNFKCMKEDLDSPNYPEYIAKNDYYVEK